MHFFSTPTFLAAAQAADPALAKAVTTDVHVEGLGRYRTLRTPRGKLLTALPFVDYLLPLDDSVESAAATTHTRHIDNAVLEELDISEFRRLQQTDDLDIGDPIPADDRGGRRTISPFVDWSGFETFDDYITSARSTSKRAFRELRRKVSLVEREFGQAPVFTFDDDDPAHFELCLDWKAQQYVATGNTDLIADGAGALMRALRDAGDVVVSTLCVGDRLLAGHIGFVHDHVFHYWLPAYDDSAAKAAPGVRLLELMLAASFERGHTAFDFLEGQEAYKFNYATHVRVVGTVGTVPAALSMARRLRRRIGTEIRQRPGIGGVLDRLRSLPRPGWSQR